jgi:hypothetical protein
MDTGLRPYDKGVAADEPSPVARILIRRRRLSKKFT